MIGYKKCTVEERRGRHHWVGEAIVTLDIPDTAKKVMPNEQQGRHNDAPFGEQKCRCSKATVVKIEWAPGYARRGRKTPRFTKKDAETYRVVSAYVRSWRSWGKQFAYRVGQTVKPRLPFNTNPAKVCASGIHFFKTRERAERYSL